MWQIADGDSVKQADVSFLHRWTYAFDPRLPFDASLIERQVSTY